MGFSGRAGSSSIGTSTDVALNSPSNGQALVYDTSLGKWKNGTISGSGVGVGSTIPSALATSGSAGSSAQAARADHIHPTTGVALITGGQRIFVQASDPGSSAQDGDIWIQA